MNKKWGKKLLLVLLIISVIYFPNDIQAKKNKCTVDFFDVSKYSTNPLTGYSNGHYIYGINARTIKITVSKPKRYQVFIYKGAIDTVSGAEHLAGLSQGDLNKMYGKGKISKTKIEVGDLEKDYTIKVEPGTEALVVVVYKGDKDTKATQSDKCNNTTGKSKDGCCIGYFKQNGEDDEIYGTGASTFVENPTDNFLVPNLRAVGASTSGVSNACTNAYNGIFQPVNKEYEKDAENFTIKNWSGDLNTWRNEYFNKMFPYCTTPSVAFNLSDHNIKIIANKLLRMFKYIPQLQSVGSAGYDSINAEINRIKDDLENRHLSNNYYIKDNGTSIGNSNILNSSLQCNYSDLVYNKTEKKVEYKDGSGESDYLYAEKGSISVDIKTLSSKKRTYKVCDTACYEHLKVVYSPPQVVKAGLCFQYKVTIKSVTDCGADFNEGLKDILSKPPGDPNGMYPEMCSATPICDGNETKVSAGPSKDFDDCVSTCDGGEYTQSCINKCYKKVYGNTSKKSSSDNKIQKSSNENKTDNIKEVNPSFMIQNNNNNSNLINIANISKLKSDDDFTEYFDGNKLPGEYKNICGSNKNIRDHIDDCAEYFFTAKSVKPYGHYSCNNNGHCSWNQTATATNCNSSYYGCEIARVATYYARDLESTKMLIKRLIGGSLAGLSSEDRRYIVNNNGILVQRKNSGWYCQMSCSHHGCTNDKALTSGDYTDLMNENLKAINQALRDCNELVVGNNNDPCEPSNGVKASTFDINIKTNTKRGSDEPGTKTGSNKLHSSLVDPPEPNCPDDKMFVKADKNDSSSSLNGIFGTCYNEVGQDDNGNRVHYQTTITFPGSWIDLKTGEVFYDCKEEGYKNKVQYYCTPFDSFNVNTNWWNWAVNNEYNGSAPAPDDWNIEAHLGFVNERNEDVGFGKYKWHIGFQCFYSQLDEIIGSPLPPPDGPSCYRGKEGTSEECPDDSDKKGTSTKVNYDIRIVDLENLFPNNRLRGFNWGDAAQLKSTDPQIQTALKTTGYGVSPVDYSHIVQGLDSYGGEGGEKIYDKDYDLRVVLNADNVANIKNEKIDDFSGNYTAVNNIPGLYYYRMPDTFLSLVSSYDINWERGKNSKMAIKVTK